MADPDAQPASTAPGSRVPSPCKEETLFKHALFRAPSADNLADATAREIERIARELLKRGSESDK